MPPGLKIENRTTRFAVPALAAVTLSAFAVRWIHSGDSLGGFLSFNEAWYSIVATNYTDFGSFLFPTTVYGAVDYNVSPFLSYVLYISIRLFGLSESALRLAPVAFSALTCPVLYCLGARLFNRRTGLAAAAFYAFAPASVIVGRNVQADAVYVFLMLLSLLLYLKSEDGEKRSIPLMAAAGLLFGAAFLTKQFAAILLPVIALWELIRNRNIRWLGAGHLVFGLAALAVPGPFFFYHLYFNGAALLGAQSALSSEKYVTGAADLLRYIVSEYTWGVSPPILALALAGLVYSLKKHFHGGVLILLAVAVFNWFFYRWHVHSYYILFAVPFLCLAAGALVGGIKWRAAAAVAALAVSAFAAVLSVAMLCSVKYGFGEFRLLADIAEKQPVKPVVILTDTVAGSYYPAARFYNRELDLVRENEIAGLGSDEVFFRNRKPVFIIGYGPDDRKRLPPSRVFIPRDAYGLIFFGYQFVADMESEHFFSVKRIYFMRNGRVSDFGVVKVGRYQSMILAYGPPGFGIPIKDGRIVFGGLE